MILTARDLRALLKHFDLPEEGSQEELLKRLKYFLVRTDRLSGFETVKQTPPPSPRTVRDKELETPPSRQIDKNGPEVDRSLAPVR
jgi:hypothetical protein